MMRPIAAAMLALVLHAGPSLAAPAAPAGATTLDQLLGEVRSRQEQESAENRARLEAFRREKSEQSRLLAAALAEQKAEEERSDALKVQYDENEARIPELQEKLRNRMGTLGEVFGVVRQVAGDTRAQFQTSLVSAQFPGRDEYLGTLAESSENPHIEDLEKVWFLLQQQMTEQGKVVRFPATVVSVGGGEETQPVVRVGPFNAVSQGVYLNYVPETGKLGELARQPASRHLATVAELETSHGEVVGFALDPSSGSILNKLIQAPTMEERIEQGGPVGYVIIALGVIGMILSFYRMAYLWVVGGKMRRQLGRNEADPGNPLGRVLGVYDDHRDSDLETIELKLDEAIMKETPRLERGESLIKTLSVVAPLLGLLGTVTGMIQTFQAITLFGTGDPKMMADGISQALVTTVHGLVMAIPLTLVYSIVSSSSSSLVQMLEEQSQGLLAERAEAAVPSQELRRAVAS